MRFAVSLLLWLVVFSLSLAYPARLKDLINVEGVRPGTETFKLLPAIERQLLYIQISTMSTYGATLSTRIDLAKGN